LVSIIELNWVLSACYDLKREQVAQAILSIMRCKVFIVERADQVLRALRVFNKGKADFADCLIERIALSAGCSQTMTFDTGAAKYTGMTLIK
jgi:predicted nucleic-acid-binding protein